MPCISIQFEPNNGPIIQLGIAPPASMQGLIAGQPNIQITGATALLDTGASVTCITSKLAQDVGLKPMGKRPMSSASGTKAMNTYLADVFLPFGDPTSATGVPMHGHQNMILMEFDGGSPLYQALLGRDIICNGFFSMAGYDKRFTICM